MRRKQPLDAGMVAMVIRAQLLWHRDQWDKQGFDALMRLARNLGSRFKNEKDAVAFFNACGVTPHAAY